MRTSENYNKAFNEYVNSYRFNDECARLAEGLADSDGYIVPHGFADDYNAVMNRENLFRRHATIIHTADKGFIQTFENEAMPEVVAEFSQYPEDGGILTKTRIDMHKIALLDKVSTDLFTDNRFDIQKHINTSLAKRFARAEEKLFINSTDTATPTGLISSAETGATAETGEISLDDIIRLHFSLEPEYRKNAVWLMNDETAFMLRTAKTADGTYLWNHNDNTLLGKNVEISQYMPSVASGSVPVIFGDLSYYWVLIHQPLTVQKMTEMYAMQNITGFRACERINGILTRSEAVKKLIVK